MKKIALLISFLFYAFISTAQYARGGGGAFSFGMQTLSTSQFATFDPNAPSLNEAAFSFGGYGYWQLNDWLFGFKGAGVYGPKQLSGDYEYSYSGGYFMLDFGYKVVNTQKFFVYPFVGVGWGGAGYTINSKFSINLNDPNNKPAIYAGNYNWSNVVFDAGVRIEQLFGLKSADGETGGGLVGIEVGYMFSPTSTDWRTNTNATIIGAPEFNMNGLYARIVFGGFGGN